MPIKGVGINADSYRIKGDLDLQFRCQMKVESWSTYQEEKVGLVATTISFLDEKDDFLGALHYYLRPDYSHESTLKDRWIKLSEETETPTDWYEVKVSLQQVLQEELGIGGGEHPQNGDYCRRFRDS